MLGIFKIFTLHNIIDFFSIEEWIQIQIGSVLWNFVDPDPYSEYGSTKVKIWEIRGKICKIDDNNPLFRDLNRLKISSGPIIFL